MEIRLVGSQLIKSVIPKTTNNFKKVISRPLPKYTGTLLTQLVRSKGKRRESRIITGVNKAQAYQSGRVTLIDARKLALSPRYK